MCGVTGYWGSYKFHSIEERHNCLNDMTVALVHRGPDAGGMWFDDDNAVGLGHRRLSVQDLSEAGKQPMISSSDQFVISYNGEIYNFLEIRDELINKGSEFRGHSDTEVLLEAIQVFGLEATLQKCNGMFAFVLWDRKTKTLTLARDRVGKKPIYYGYHNGVLLFGSELKSLIRHPAFEKTINHDALLLLIKYSWISSPYCIFQNTKKLEPASYITFDSPNHFTGAKPKQYWSAYSVLQSSSKNIFNGSIEEAQDELETRLVNATQKRMVADVGVGALLSGGIDSSIVTAVMQSLSPRPIKTYSIGYHEQTHNEAEHAKKVSEYLGTEHHELYLEPKDSLEVIPKIPTIYDEPFADVSQIPTYLISKLARESVTVALTGDGGDEAFAGYTRYTRCMEQWNQYQKIPEILKPVLSNVSNVFSNALWQVNKNRQCRSRKVGKYQKISRRINAVSAEDLFCRMNMRHAISDSLVFNANEPNNIFTDYPVNSEASTLKNLQYIDYVNYMVDDVMAKVDRASMAVSLETRSPLLDYKVLELAWSLPDDYLCKGKIKKIVLKELLYKYVPKDLVDRPKWGFGVPIGRWLRDDLHEWASDLLSQDSIKRQGLFDVKLVNKFWQQQISGCAKHDTLIWSLLMFQSWYSTYLEGYE